jgi:hypothetical protein
MELLYIKDRLFVCWETKAVDGHVRPAFYWWREEKEIRIGYLSITYSKQP